MSLNLISAGGGGGASSVASHDGGGDASPARRRPDHDVGAAGTTTPPDDVRSEWIGRHAPYGGGENARARGALPMHADRANATAARCRRPVGVDCSVLVNMP